MKKQILSEEFRRMQKLAGVITENDMSNDMSGKPRAITVESTEKFESYMKEQKNSLNQIGFSQIPKGGQRELWYNHWRDAFNCVKIGTVPYDNPKDLEVNYWASYNPKADQIDVYRQDANVKEANDPSFKDDITNYSAVFGKLVSDFYCKFKSIEVGQKDDKGYFTIVGVDPITESNIID